MQTYTPSFESVVGSIYYQTENMKGPNWKRKDFLVSFADYEKNLDENTRNYYLQTQELITTIDDSSSVVNATLRSLLVTLKNDIAKGDKNAQRGDIVQIEEFLDKNQPKLSPKQTEKLNNLLNELSDYATLSAKGAGTYEVAKEEILSLLPLELKKQILNGFARFDAVNGSESQDMQTERVQLLETITATIYQSVAKSDSNIGENEIANEDYQNIVKPNICKIANEFNLTTNLCSDFNKDNPDYKPVLPAAPESSKSSAGLPAWLKVLLWIVGIVVLSFIGLIVAFAVKARLREKYEDEEE